MKFVIYQIDVNRKASEIIQEVDVFKVISWIKAAGDEISNQTVINCFHKCGFRNKAQDGLDQDEDKEFTNSVRKLLVTSSQMITWILTRILLPRC